MGVGLRLVKLWRCCFQKRCLNSCFDNLAIDSKAGGDEFLQPQFFEVLSKVFGKVAPFWIIARQQNCLATKYVGIVIEIGLHFYFYIIEHGIELVLFCGLSL